jgi:hypothetical protein
MRERRRTVATEHRREPIRRISLSVFAMHEGTAHDRRGQALVDDLGELPDDFDFHNAPSLAARKTRHEVKLRKLVCCVSVYRHGINMPLLSKTVIVDAAVQAQTISSVTGCE